MTAPENDPNNNDDVEQPLVQHLTELRNRLLYCFLFILLVFGGLFYFANEIYSYVSAPLQKFLPENSSMIATEVASPFLTPFKLTLFVAVFISIPYVFYQLWAFVAPALYRREKRLALPLLISSVVLFYAGMAFAYYAVFPLVFGFFTRIAPTGVTVMTDISNYLDFVLKLFFAFGLAFEIPVATVLLISANLVSAEGLAHKRPYIIVGCFVLGMLLTPPDVISQLLLALPMWLLFEIGVVFGRLVVKDQQKEQKLEEKQDR